MQDSFLYLHYIAFAIIKKQKFNLYPFYPQFVPSFTLLFQRTKLAKSSSGLPILPFSFHFSRKQENKMVPCQRWRTTRRCRIHKNHVTRLLLLSMERPRHEQFLRRTYHGEFFQSMLSFLYDQSTGALSRAALVSNLFLHPIVLEPFPPSLSLSLCTPWSLCRLSSPPRKLFRSLRKIRIHEKNVTYASFWNESSKSRVMFFFFFFF